MYNDAMADIDIDLAVGILVWNEQDELLLLEKAEYPWGFTPPTVIVDQEQDPEEVARNRLDELGLETHNLESVFDDRDEGREHPLNGTYCQWVVFEAKFAGEYEGLSEEEPDATWASHEMLEALAKRTARYHEDQLSDEAWERQPGLDTSWHDILAELGVITSPRLAMDEFDETDESDSTRSDQEPPSHPPST